MNVPNARVCRKTIAIAMLLLVIASARPVSAQKMFVLIAGDTQDPVIGANDEMDLNRIRMAFGAHVPDSQLVFYSSFADGSAWSGPAVDRAPNVGGAILEAIARCPARRDDTIVFYWSGHGAYDSGGHYLVMPDRTPLYRKDVLAAIDRKSPRLAVLISDACNTHLDSRRLALPMAPALAPPPQISPLFDELFMKHRGVVDMNASSEEEVAIALDECGGLFTSRWPLRRQPSTSMVSRPAEEFKSR